MASDAIRKIGAGDSMVQLARALKARTMSNFFTAKDYHHARPVALIGELLGDLLGGYRNYRLRLSVSAKTQNWTGSTYMQNHQ